MKPRIYGIILLPVLIFLTVMLVFAMQNNRKLVHEKKQLILKNDSLHIKQLEVKHALALLSRKVDSLTHIKHSNNIQKLAKW
jgi:cell division protein FtsL